MLKLIQEGNRMELEAKGNSKELADDAVKVVLSVCESLAKQRNDEDFFKVLLKYIIVRLIGVDRGYMNFNSFILGRQALQKGAEQDESDKDPR